MRIQHNDPGLQPERTSLAWTRTSVSLVIASMILLRWSEVYGIWIFPLIVFLALLSSGIYFTQRFRYRIRVDGFLREAAQPGIGSVLLLTAALLIFGTVGIYLIMLAG